MRGPGSLDRVHDHNFFDLSAVQNRQYLLQLLLGGNENHARAGVSEKVGCLLRSQGRIDGNDHRAQEQ